MDNIFYKIIYFSEHEHGGGGISRSGYTTDFADVLKQIFVELQTITFEFPFNGNVFSFTLWDLIKLELVLSIGIYIISKFITKFGGNYE